MSGQMDFNSTIFCRVLTGLNYFSVRYWQKTTRLLDGQRVSEMPTAIMLENASSPDSCKLEKLQRVWALRFLWEARNMQSLWSDPKAIRISWFFLDGWPQPPWPGVAGYPQPLLVVLEENHLGLRIATHGLQVHVHEGLRDPESETVTHAELYLHAYHKNRNCVYTYIFIYAHIYTYYIKYMIYIYMIYIYILYVCVQL